MCALVLLTLVTFANSQHNAFVSDDIARIVENPAIRAVQPVWRHFVDPTTSATEIGLMQYRPLMPLSFSLDVALWGEASAAFHRGAMVWHLLGVCLVFALLCELTRHWSAGTVRPASAVGIAFAAAALYAVHPVTGMVVNYLSARDLLLSQCFLLLTLLCYARHRRLPAAGAWRRWTAMLVAFALALLSKQNVFVLPGLLVAFDLLCARSPLRARGLWLRPLPFVALILAFFVWTELGLQFADRSRVVTQQPWTTYAITQLAVHTGEYLASFVWPFGLRMHPAVVMRNSLLEPSVLVGAVVIMAAAALVWVLRRRHPLISFGVAAYAILMSLEGSVFPFVWPVVYYRPVPGSVFLWLAVVLGVTAALAGRGRRWRVPLTALALAVTAGSSVAMNRHWATPASVWTHAMAHGGNVRARLGLLLATVPPDDPRFNTELDAIAEEEVRALGLRFVNARLLDRAALRDTSVASTYFQRAHVARRAGNTTRARAEGYIAARLAPQIVTYQVAAMVDAQIAEDWAAVLEFAAAFAAVDAQQAVSDFASGFALQRLGRLDEAVARYERYLRRDDAETSADGREQVRVNLVVALGALGRCPDAGPHLRALEALSYDAGALRVLRAECATR